MLRILGRPTDLESVELASARRRSTAEPFEPFRLLAVGKHLVVRTRKSVSPSRPTGAVWVRREVDPNSYWATLTRRS
jgi:hypothetical protein